MDYRIIECLFSIIGVILSSILIWGWTYDMRYKFKVKYFLRPKFKKGDYVLDYMFLPEFLFNLLRIILLKNTSFLLFKIVSD